MDQPMALPTHTTHTPSCRDMARETAVRWDLLLRSRKATIDYLNTYQGRRPGHNTDSTNGCAVIAPLIGYVGVVTWGGGVGRGA